MPDVKVTVVMAVYNAGAYLARSLQSICQSSYPNIEVIVIDDCSTDDSLSIAVNHPCHVVPLSERCGPAKARNIGVALASGGIIFFTDADVIVRPDVIERAVAYLSKHPTVAAVIGAYTKETPGDNFVTVYKNLLHHFVHRTSGGPVAGFFTACGAIRRKIFERAGGFAESAKDCALEDLELGLRLFKQGEKIILLPGLQVTHLKRYTLGSLTRADLWQRAVPYTVHMLRHRLFRNELSTRNHNRASVATVYMVLLLGVVSPVTSNPLLYLVLLLGGLLIYMGLNRSFYRFLWKETNPWFLLRAVGLQFYTYLYSGLGLVLGLCRYLIAGGGRPAPAENSFSVVEGEPLWVPSRPRQRLANPHVLPIPAFVPGKSVSEIREEFAVDEVVKLASNENLLGPSPLALKAIGAALADVHFYPDSQGLELKRALAKRYGLSSENLILGNGSSQVLDIIARTFLCPGDELITAHPTFPLYQRLGQACGAQNVVAPLKNHRHDLPAMAERMTDRTKLIIIANPNNPTGTLVSPPEIESFLNRVPDDVIVVFDQAYIEYVSDAASRALPSFSETPVIIVKTFSKFMGLAGLRIGYGIADPEIIELLDRVRIPFNTSAIAQAAAMASLSDHQYVERTRKMVAEGKNYLYRQFERLGIDYVPSHANFIFVDLHQDAQAVSQALHRRGIIVRPGLKTFARITVSTSEQNAAFISALEQVLAERSGRAEAA